MKWTLLGALAALPLIAASCSTTSESQPEPTASTRPRGSRIVIGPRCRCWPNADEGQSTRNRRAAAAHVRRGAAGLAAGDGSGGADVHSGRPGRPDRTSRRVPEQRRPAAQRPRQRGRDQGRYVQRGHPDGRGLPVHLRPRGLLRRRLRYPSRHVGDHLCVAVSVHGADGSPAASSKSTTSRREATTRSSSPAPSGWNGPWKSPPRGRTSISRSRRSLRVARP